MDKYVVTVDDDNKLGAALSYALTNANENNKKCVIVSQTKFSFGFSMINNILDQKAINALQNNKTVNINGIKVILKTERTFNPHTA
jgi:hypothetical protein